MLQTWWLGVLLIIIGSFSSAVGLLLMKKSADTEKQLPFWRRRIWMFGFAFLMVNATTIDVFAYSMTPLALIAPFSGLTIVFTTLLAQSGWLNKQEDVTRVQWLAISIVFISVVTISTSGPHTSARVTADTFQMLGRNMPFMTFAVFSMLGIVSSILCWALQVRQNSIRVPLAFTFTLAFGAASAGAMSQLFLKIVSTGFADYLNGESVAKPYTIVALVGLIAFAPLQLMLLNSTLTNSPVAFAVPLYQTLLILLTIIAGATFFDEFNQMNPSWGFAFAVGVVSSIGGLLALSAATQAASTEEAKRLIRPPLDSIKV